MAMISQAVEGVYNHKCFTWPASKVSQAREGGRPWQWLGRQEGEQQEGARSDGGRTCRGGRSQRSEMTCFTYCSFGFIESLYRFVTCEIFVTLFIELRRPLLAVSAT